MSLQRTKGPLPWVLGRGRGQINGMDLPVMDIGAMPLGSRVSGCLGNSGKARKIDFDGLSH